MNYNVWKLFSQIFMFPSIHPSNFCFIFHVKSFYGILFPINFCSNHYILFLSLYKRSSLLMNIWHDHGQRVNSLVPKITINVISIIKVQQYMFLFKCLRITQCISSTLIHIYDSYIIHMNLWTTNPPNDFNINYWKQKLYFYSFFSLFFLGGGVWGETREWPVYIKINITLLYKKENKLSIFYLPYSSQQDATFP